MTHAVFISRSTSRPALQKLSSIAGVLLALATPLGIASCKPTANAPPRETQETSPGDANAAKVVKDFGPTLLKIGTQYSISSGEYVNSLRGSLYGFVDLNGKVVIEPQWEEASDFFAGVASVKRGGKWGWLDKTGQLFLPPLSSPPDFQEGLVPFERGGKWGYMNTKATVVIQPEWENAREFNDGYAEVKRGGKCGVIDKTGHLIIPLGNYEGLYFEPELGLWGIVVNKKRGYMDKAGRVVIKPQWDYVLSWHQGLALVFRDQKAGLIDKTGKVVVPLEWEDALPFSEGVAPVKQNGKWGFIDKTGKVVISLQWEDAHRFHKGLAGVRQNGKWGLIDRTGKIVIEPRWEELGDLGGELVLLKEKKKFGFIDRTGRVVIEPQWDIAEDYRETRWDMSVVDENEPIYWLVAREEKPELGQAQSKPIVRVLWLDSAGKQIWSSMGATISESGQRSPSPQEH